MDSVKKKKSDVTRSAEIFQPGLVAERGATWRSGMRDA
jgi:hypothetical protein